MQKRILAISMALAMIIAMALPMGVSAATSQSVVVSGAVASTISVNDPGDMTLDLDGSSPQTANCDFGVTSNSGWTVDVKDHNTDISNKGFLLKGSTIFNESNKLQLSKNGVNGWTEADTGIQFTGIAGTGIVNSLYVSQVVTGGEAPGTYSMTIDIVGSSNP